MTIARRNLLWPLLIAALGVAWLLIAVDAIPDAVGDLLVRAWPALLILIGLDALLGRRRVVLGGRSVSLSGVSFAVVLALVGAVIWLAYQKQADTLRTDQTQSFSQPLPDDIGQVEVIAALQRTAVSVGPGDPAARTLAADYTGSRDSVVSMTWETSAGTGTLTITESAGDAIPRLESYGRAALDVRLPQDASISLLRFASTAGGGTLDLETLRVERVEANLAGGSLVLTLPSEGALSGRLQVAGGDIELRVPPGVALTVSLAEDSGEPVYVYDEFKYDLLRDGTLKQENTEEFQAGLTIWLRSGATLRVTDLP